MDSNETERLERGKLKYLEYIKKLKKNELKVLTKQKLLSPDHLLKNIFTKMKLF